jgi:uncharacterized protein (TIGR00369 family)
MTTELTETRKSYLHKDYSRGFIAYCGLEAVEFSPGAMVSKVDILDHHRQQDGFIHAGVLAAMADHTAGYAAYTLIPENHRILTIEFKINLLRPAVGPSLVCRARVIKPGRKIMVCESEVFDQRPEKEVLAAKMQATMAVVPENDLVK